MASMTSARRQQRPTAPCLVVEDSTFDQQRIARAVSHGCRDLQLVFSKTIKDAREKLNKGPFSMILLDNNLPDGMGADFAVELSQNPDHSAKPIVIVSDWPSPFMWDKARTAGVRHIVSKSDFHAGYVQHSLGRSGTA